MRFVQMLRTRMNRANIYNTSSFWDSKAENHVGDSVSMWQNKHLNALYDEEQKKIISPRLKSLSNLRVLDIGCGTGRMARHFATLGAKVLAFDFSSKSVDVAKAMGTYNGAITYDVRSVFDLRIDQEFDFAFTWGVLTVACSGEADLMDALSRIYRALKIEGEFLLLEPIHKNFLRRVLKMDLETFICCIKKAGFEPVETTQLHFWPARLLLCYADIPIWITKPIYNLGQCLMKFFPAAGDYTAIVAKKIMHPLKSC